MSPAPLVVPPVVLPVVLFVLLGVVLLAAARLLHDPRTVPDVRHDDGADDQADGQADHGAASVSVVVPARDEAATLPALLEAVRSLDHAVLEVVVVDDHSGDATATVARAGGAVVVAAPPLPSGWTGKAWACHTGAAATSGDLVLFLDADTVLSPRALSGLLALHRRHGGLVSVQPFHAVVRPYEQLSAYFNVLALLASAAVTSRATAHPMAFGPCLLTSRSDYLRAGGHDAVRSAILDDVELARAYARVGLPTHCAVGGSAVRMRSYPGGWRQLASGWTKNFASGAAAAAAGPAAVTVGWIGAHHAVAVGLGLCLVEAGTGELSWLAQGDPRLWAVAWVAVVWQLRSFLRRAGAFRWWTWLLFPVPLLFFDLVFFRSLGLTAVRRSVRWRGREVDLHADRSAGEVS